MSDDEYVSAPDPSTHLLQQAFIAEIRDSVGVDPLAEVCAEVRRNVQEACEERDLGTTAGIAALLVVSDSIVESATVPPDTEAEAPMGVE